MERAAVTRYGLSFSEFWDSTPRELDMLMEGFIYQQQLESNRVRTLMAAIYNTIPSKHKRTPIKGSDLMYLDMLDSNRMSVEEAKEEQEKAEKALEWVKNNW